MNAAKLNCTEDIESSIEYSKYTDFVVLDKNSYDEKKTSVDDLVQMTIVNGKIVDEKDR